MICIESLLLLLKRLIIIVVEVIDNNCELLVKMVFPCRNEKCERLFSTISNRNKHKRLKNHGPQSEDKIEIPFFNVLSIVI